MNVLSQRYSGISSTNLQSKYMFVLIDFHKTKEEFIRVQGHDFWFLRGVSIEELFIPRFRVL